MHNYKKDINVVDIININHLYKLINKYNNYRILINQPKLRLNKQYKNIDNFIECNINDDNFESMINRLMSATTMLIADINHQNKTILIYNKKLNLPTFENYMNMNMKYQDKIILENLIKKYGKNDILTSINENTIYESANYDYDEETFNPRKCFIWLLNTGLIDEFNPSLHDVDEYATMVQYAAEDAGVPLDDAERVYDIVCMRYDNY